MAVNPFEQEKSLMLKFALLLLLSVAVSSQAVTKTYSDKDGQRLEFDSFSGSDLWGTKGNPIKAHGILYLPKNASKENKVPLAIIISGLGGQRGRDNRMCDVLSSNGIACFGVRTYASRGVKHTWKSSQKFKVAGLGSRFHDAYGALEALRIHPVIDQSNIWQIGFSLGGNLSALALDPILTRPFQRSEHDFKGFISLYAFCMKTTTTKLKSLSFHQYLGDADAAYHKEECNDFISSLKKRGVDAHFTLFEGSQFNKIGHLWDNMQAATGGWHGYPEGPWKMHKDGKVYSNNGIFIYECDFEIDPSAQTISAGNDIIVKPNDNEGWNFVIEKCGKRKSTNVNRHMIIKKVDEEIIRIILG